MTEPLVLKDAEVIGLCQLHLPFYLATVRKTDDPEHWSGKAMPSAHHEAIIQALTQQTGHTLIVMPRGAAKTTIVQSYIEWMLGRASLTKDKDWAQRFRVLYLSHAAHMAFSVSTAIMNTIAGEVYQQIFPKVKPSDKKWSEMEWRVKGNEGNLHATFKAGGIDSPPLGGRFNLIILDDIADAENMKNPQGQQKIIHTIEQTVAPMLVPVTGRFIMPCTRWAWNDPPQWAMDQGWHTLYMKALQTDEDGNEFSYWPERFPLEFLQEERRQKPRAFAQQYQNEVAPEEGIVFQREWFHDRYDSLPTNVIAKVNAWDTAQGEGRNRSHSVGLSALVTADWHVYLKYMFRDQVPYPDLRRAVLWLAQEDRLRIPISADDLLSALIIEKRSAGHSLLQEFTEMRVTDHLPIVEWQPFGQRGSPQRHEANVRISDICAQGMLHLPSDKYLKSRGDTWIVPFEKALFAYPEGDQGIKCDVTMTLSMLLWWVQEQRLKGYTLNSEPLKLRWSRERGRERMRT